jgi:hypothetical protein
MLINRHPFLTDTDEYKAAINYGEKYLQKAKDLLKQGDYKKVINISEILQKFPMFKEEAEELKKQATLLSEFHRLLAKHDYNMIEKFVKEHPFLEDVDDYKALEREWRNKLQEAEVYASNGEIQKILNILNDYIKVSDKRFKIGQLIRSAYLQQILSLIIKIFKGEKIPNANELLQKAFENYIKIFGFDIEISDLVEKAKKLKINVDLSGIKEGDITTWHMHKLPDKIWEG